VDTPGVKHKAEEIIDASVNSPLLTGEKATAYRSVTMRAQYYSQDRPDICYASKECARHMQEPNEYNLSSLKRLGRYLVRYPRLVQWFPEQDNPKHFHVKGDTDHAGCVLTRKSTSGLACMYGRHCIKHHSGTQNDLALSSGESEFSGVVKSASCGLGLKAMATDLNAESDLTIGSDSSAALAMTKRRGLGKVRHISLRYLWVQKKLVDEVFDLEQLKSASNVGDLFTKHLAAKVIQQHLRALNYHYVEGRSSNAPNLLKRA